MSYFGICGVHGVNACVHVVYLMCSILQAHGIGNDAVGIASIRGKGEVKVVKCLTPRGLLIDLPLTPKLVEELNGRTVLASTGSYTVAEKKSYRYIQPFIDCRKELFLLHDGYVENYVKYYRELKERGHKFATEVNNDVISSEVVVHMLEECIEDAINLLDALLMVCSKLGNDLRGIVVAAHRDVEDACAIAVCRDMSKVRKVAVAVDENSWAFASFRDRVLSREAALGMKVLAPVLSLMSEPTTEILRYGEAVLLTPGKLVKRCIHQDRKRVLIEW